MPASNPRQDDDLMLAITLAVVAALVALRVLQELI